MRLGDRRLARALEPLLREVRGREADRELVPVRSHDPWSRRYVPAVLALDRTGARLWIAQGEGVALQAEVGPGWKVQLRRRYVELLCGTGKLYLSFPGRAQAGRRERHRVAAALERALGPTPDVAARVTIDRIGRGPLAWGILAFVLVLFAVLVGKGVVDALRLRWTLDARASVVVGALLAFAADRLWLPRLRARDGRVVLYPDRVVHLQDQVRAVPWTKVRGFDDRPSSWVALDCDPPLSIPTVDEATRTAVLAALDAVGLRRSS